MQTAYGTTRLSAKFTMSFLLIMTIITAALLIILTLYNHFKEVDTISGAKQKKELETKQKWMTKGQYVIITSSLLAVGVTLYAGTTGYYRLLPATTGI